MTGIEEELREVDQRLALLGGRRVLERAPGVHCRRVVVVRRRRRDHQVMVRNAERFRCSTVQLDDGVEFPPRFGEATADLRKTAETGEGTTSQLGQTSLEPETLDLLI